MLNPTALIEATCCIVYLFCSWNISPPATNPMLSYVNQQVAIKDKMKVERRMGTVTFSLRRRWMAAVVRRLQPPDKPLTSRPGLEGFLNGIAFIWVVAVYRLHAQLKMDPAAPQLNNPGD